ncbi:MAG TPA: fasciclin domain-containing protein [Acidimicrobiia bacterium]|nr:fasciclin domain-containing protein [Acidimicrobiia bacterium]
MNSRALVVLVMIALLAACGGGDEGTTDTTVEMMGDTSSTEAMTDEEMLSEDVLAVAEAEGDLGTFLTAIDSAGMMEDLHGEGPFTVFAPTDNAFDAYLESSGMTQEEALAGGEMLQSVIGYHLVSMMEDSAMVMTMDGDSLTTVSGAPLEVTVDGENVMVGDATVLRYDIEASNGVIHVIDTVLAPPQG